MTVDLNSPSLLAAMRGWWQERAPQLGFAKTASQFAKELWEFARDSTPQRKRQRYGDADYDWEYRVDTTSATVRFRDRLLGVFHSAYQPTEPAAFREMMQALPIDYSQFTFIDLGSGKGRTLLMASEFPFRRIIGVELLPSLHQIAKENAEKFAGDGAARTRIETVCADATTYEFPRDPLVLYLFNPLPEAALAKTLQNLQQSLEESPREVLVVYHNPLLDWVLVAARVFRKTKTADQYAIYEFAPVAEATSRSEAVSK
jgi:SAM-dependent methyltransferase